MATVHGHVRPAGGPAPAAGGSGIPTPNGSALVFTTASRTGSPALTVPIDAGGSYTLQLHAGRYYLATTAAACDGVPAGGPALSVAAGEDLLLDLTPSIK
jgi:hypothetical protein